MSTFSIYTGIKAAPVSNDEYAQTVRALIHQARQKIWIAMFIVNPVVEQDPNKVVRQTIKALELAQWKGLDVRFLIGNSANRDIAIANKTAFDFCQFLAIPSRVYRGDLRRSLHSKYVVVDRDTLLIGSHNWTSTAATANVEDSLMIQSKDLNRLVAMEHRRLWQHSEPRHEDRMV